ncbi:MAG: hypothetical protein ABR879_05330 [Methanomassiliicoccales archaeon]|jgi:hypothetical protein
MHIIVYDDQCQAEAIVEKFEDNWWGRIVGTIRQIPEEEAPRRTHLLLSKDNDDAHRLWKKPTARTSWHPNYYE